MSSYIFFLFPIWEKNSIMCLQPPRGVSFIYSQSDKEKNWWNVNSWLTIYYKTQHREGWRNFYFYFKLIFTLVIARGHLGGKVHSSVDRCRRVHVPQCLRWREWWAQVARSQTPDSAHSPLTESHLGHTECREKAGENPERNAGQKQTRSISSISEKLPSVKGRTSWGETNLWKVSSSFGN